MRAVLDGLRSQGGKVLKQVPFLRAVNPNVVTLLGIAFAVLAAYLICAGQLWWAIPALTASGLTDLLDGVVARRAGRVSKRGAFLDSVADRVIETVICGGIVYYLAQHKGAGWALLGLAALGSGYLISYERAKAESMGYEGRGGLMERAERLILLGVSLGFSGAIMIPTLVVLVTLNLGTAATRFLRVYVQAAREDGLEIPETLAKSVDRLEGRRRPGVVFERTRRGGSGRVVRRLRWVDLEERFRAMRADLSRRYLRQDTAVRRRRSLGSRWLQRPDDR
jgi:CDP-diacylglycerol--glycerol-3-phosphate 3-phosphatidyltransferase